MKPAATTPELRETLLALPPATLVDIIEEHRAHLFALTDICNVLTEGHQAWLDACNRNQAALSENVSRLIDGRGALPN
ncbi:hypothetical protein [Methylosinus sp. KRF6]|uniref:hypothetical protein n=1 Tax=Methylosinus sp. KRF6 TaxID=2846853 RepID=UPI001C0D4B10|nr:hypothetical protein [Methylosinus sp. KRF6]MBU3889857.1 hypothetical protein [Methylosinus sp. KRF6]